MNPKVDTFFEKAKKWKSEFEILRMVVLECGLSEELKWKHPCYTYKGENIVLIHGFKEYCALLFFKGALLNDKEDLLIQQTENVQAARQLRFTNATEIENRKSAIKAYIFEAIEVEKAGLKVPLKNTKDYPVPDELTEKFSSDPELESAFKALTPGRQRGYLLHFSQAKQSKTRASRIDKQRERIIEGKGLNDK